MTTFFKILAFLPIGALFLAIIAIFITSLMKTKSDFKNYSSSLAISFKSFIDLYKIIPNKWIISEKQDKVFYKAHLNSCYTVNQDFYFITLKDIIQFRYWRKFVYKKNLKKKQIQEIEIRRNKIMSECIKLWSNDIAKVRENNIEEVKKAIRENTEKVEYYRKKYKELKKEIKDET